MNPRTLFVAFFHDITTNIKSGFSMFTKNRARPLIDKVYSYHDLRAQSGQSFGVFHFDNHGESRNGINADGFIMHFDGAAIWKRSRE